MSNKNSWSYTTDNGYSLHEDGRCHWWLKKNGQIIANSKTLYPLLEYALRKYLITYYEAVSMAKILQIPEKYISSLSEPEEK